MSKKDFSIIFKTTDRFNNKIVLTADARDHVVGSREYLRGREGLVKKCVEEANIIATDKDRTTTQNYYHLHGLEDFGSRCYTKVCVNMANSQIRTYFMVDRLNERDIVEWKQK